jgi:hypothetical protein
VIEADELDVGGRLVALVVMSEEGAEGAGQVSLPGGPLVHLNPFVKAAVVDREQVGYVGLRRAVEKWLEEFVKEIVGGAALPRGGSIEVGAQDEVVGGGCLPDAGGRLVVGDAESGGEVLEESGFAVPGVATKDDEAGLAILEGSEEGFFKGCLDVSGESEGAVEAARLGVTVRRARVDAEEGVEPLNMLVCALGENGNGRDSGRFFCRFFERVQESDGFVGVFEAALRVNLGGTVEKVGELGERVSLG